MGKHIKYTKEVLQGAVDNSESVMGVIRFLNKKISGGLHSHISKKIVEFSIDTSHFKGQSWNKGKRGASTLKTVDILVYNRNNGRREKTKSSR